MWGALMDLAEPSYSPIERGWHNSLGDLLERAESKVLVAAPFISATGSTFFVDRLSSKMKENGQLHLLTDLCPSHVCDGSLEPAALECLIDAVPNSTLWHIPRLHAKVYIADQSRALVTSGNLTAGAFYRNLEYGIDVCDPAFVQAVLDHFDLFQATGATVSREALGRYVTAASGLRETFQRQQRTASASATRALRDALREAEDDLVRLRLARGRNARCLRKNHRLPASEGRRDAHSQDPPAHSTIAPRSV